MGPSYRPPGACATAAAGRKQCGMHDVRFVTVCGKIFPPASIKGFAREVRTPCADALPTHFANIPTARLKAAAGL
jgi:hypothetical protein